MKKIGAYKILYDRQLIIEYYSGEITTEDLLFFKNAICEEPNHNLYWNTVLDLRDCNLLVKGDELPEIIDFKKKTVLKNQGPEMSHISHLNPMKLHFLHYMPLQ